jgi:hypothetical protein
METFDDTDAHAETTTDESIQRNQSPSTNGNNSTLSQPAPTPVLRQRSDTAENSIDMLSGPDLNAEEEMMILEEPPPRMPVLVAIGITVGWIFVCAALFKIWEVSFNIIFRSLTIITIYRTGLMPKVVTLCSSGINS